MNEATEALLKVKKEHPEAKGKAFQALVGKEYLKNKIKSMHDSGYSNTQIAEALKIGESTVRYNLK